MKDKILAIPKGTMQEPTISLLEKVGIKINIRGRRFSAEIDGIGIFNKVFLMRPQDIPQIIDSGKADAGICGLDCVFESGFEKKLKKITELNYSKTSRQPVKVVIFGKKKNLIDNDKIMVASEYPKIARKFFNKAQIDFSYGTTEAKVVAGMYDYGIGITETGQSLKENGLLILKTLLVSPMVLIAKYETKELRAFGELMRGALLSENYFLLTLNAKKETKQKVLSAMPSLKSPTLAKLKNGCYSISGVVLKSNLPDLIIKLKKIGAENILVQSINAVV